MSTTTKTLMTVEEFGRMSTGETEDYELVEGELIPLSSGTPLHAKIRQNIEVLIAIYFAQHGAGTALSEIDCRLSAETVRRPDVGIFMGSRLKTIDPTCIPLPFAPDIAIEVLSPSESAISVNRKTLEYLAAGSQEVWQLDFENGEIFIHTATGIRLLRGEEKIESPLLPGFSAVVRTVLAGF